MIGPMFRRPACVEQTILDERQTETSCDSNLTPLSCSKQELSYRKQTLRTQYVDGIYGNPVTLKSRSRVTQFQGH